MSFHYRLLTLFASLRKSCLEKGVFRTTCQRLADHILHVFNVAGEDTPALGSDYDRFIVPPRDLQDPTRYPRLVQCLMARGLSRAQIQKIQGLNWLRVVQAVRP